MESKYLSKYFFTQQAFELYSDITEKECFWMFFLDQNFIKEGDLIKWFMVELFYLMVLRIKVKPLEYKLPNDMNDMDAIFRNDDMVFITFNGQKEVAEADFDKAESIFSTYEATEDYNPEFGKRWWKKEHELVNKEKIKRNL